MWEIQMYEIQKHYIDNPKTLTSITINGAGRKSS